MKQIKSLTVVGGGTAGLISALILKQRSSLDVSLIYSSNIGIIGVGEGSTEHFNNFMEFVGIKPSEIIKECDATFKIGVMFDNWITNKKYLHSVGEPFGTRFGPYYAIYGKQISENSDLLCSDNLEKNLVNVNSLNVNVNPPSNQYHFNTFKLNEFLKKIALSKGIKLFDDEIVEVKLEEDGSIKTLVGKKTEYSSDFYIDATGFQRTLVNKLDVKWKSFNKYLKLNSAITFQTKDEDNYNFWTLAKAMKSGWRFKIPTWGRHGNGYIYDNNFITADKAKLELEEELGHEIEIGKTFSFDPGALETVWNKNCVAIGLSGSFFEPLEATSIGLSIQQSFLLMDKIQNYDDKVIESYNNSFNSIIENIRDFIVLHYLTKRNDTDFWKNILNLEIPESLKNNLEKWKTKLPTGEDFLNVSGYSMFGPQNFIKVMHGLNLFDKEAILKEYNFLSNEYRSAANQMINDHLHSQSFSNFMNHKDIIRVIREYN
jgi:tryptophan halogenase